VLNPALYGLGVRGRSGIVDITIGNTTVTFTQEGQTDTVQGFEAVRGYDTASELRRAAGGHCGILVNVTLSQPAEPGGVHGGR
jgi:hypothetical protein